MRSRQDSHDVIPMVDAGASDNEEEETEYNAIDCEEDEFDVNGEQVDNETAGEAADFAGTVNGLMNPRHLMRLLRTQSTKRMGAKNLQKTMARLMSDVFRVTYSAAQSAHHAQT